MSPKIIATQVKRCSHSGEYCVLAFIENEKGGIKRYQPGDYFTDDRKDAYATAKSMMQPAVPKFPGTLDIVRHKIEQKWNLAYKGPEGWRLTADEYPTEEVAVMEAQIFLKNGFDCRIEQIIEEGDTY